MNMFFSSVKNLAEKKMLFMRRIIGNYTHPSVFVSIFKFGDEYYQRSFFTKWNRYPLLFEQCKNQLSGMENPKILSFGCATGEEVFSLGRYMPNATIVGVDINEWCLQQCNKKNKSKRFFFCHRLSEEFLKSGDFDAIFCMAVFQRMENRGSKNNYTKLLTFEQFEKTIKMLDKKLKRNGLLVIDNADFSFVDTTCSRRYGTLNFKDNKILKKRPLFDKKNKKISDTHRSYRMFVKLA